LLGFVRREIDGVYFSGLGVRSFFSHGSWLVVLRYFALLRSFVGFCVKNCLGGVFATAIYVYYYYAILHPLFIGDLLGYA